MAHNAFALYRQRRQQQTKGSKPSKFLDEVLSELRKEDKQEHEDYFCWRWSRHYFPEDTKPEMEHIPGDSQILHTILESRELYYFIVEKDAAEACEWKFVPRMWWMLFETYGHDPHLLMAMWTLAKSLGGAYEMGDDFRLKKGVPQASVSSFQERIRTDYSEIGSIFPGRVEGHLFCNGFNHFLTRQYFSKLQGNTFERIEKLKLAHHQDISGGNCLLSSFTDANQAQKFKTQFFTQTKTRWWREVFLSVAGSGKTQRLFDVLSVNLGHYLMSGEVSSNEDSSQSLLNPRPGLASKDTKFLSEVMDNFQPPPKTSKIGLTKYLWRVLIRNRQMTLSFLLYLPFACELGWSGSGVLNPQDWLVFQTICTEKFDPFLETFKILLLMDFSLYRTFYPYSPLGSGDLDVTSPLISSESVIFCMDEMQSEIKDNVNEDQQPLNQFLQELFYSSATMRTQLIREPKAVFLELGTFPFIGAGTSLNYLKSQEILSKELSQDDWIADFEGNNTPATLDVISEPEMIVTAVGFHDLIHRHIQKIIDRMGYLFHLGKAAEEYHLWELLVPGDSDDSKRDSYRTIQRLLYMLLDTAPSLGHAIQSLKRFLQEIICCNEGPNGALKGQLLECSFPLRGRIRWSTVFIECLFTTFLQQPFSLPSTERELNHLRNRRSELYQHASRYAQQKIESQLRARIEELKHKGHHFLVQDLYHTAVRAHLLHRPSIFQDKDSADMLRAGFAHLRPSHKTSRISGSLEQELSEPVVIRAVINHLRATQAGRHENILRELLFANQDDSSAFGKVTEYYIGWAFGGLLLHEQGATYIEPQGRKEFLDILDDKTFIPRFHKSSLHPISSLAAYTLMQPDEGLPSDIPLGYELSYHKWLRRIRKHRYFPTFYFPSNVAGPDIVFCLRPQQGNGQRLLCAIQVKTGTSKVSKEDSFKVIRTLDPNLWFQGYEKQRQCLVRELHKNSNLTILTLLVVTSLSVEEFFTSAENLRNGLIWMRDRVCRYRNSVDNPDQQKQKNLEDAKHAYQKAEKGAKSALSRIWGDLPEDMKTRIERNAEEIIKNNQMKNPETKVLRAIAMSTDQSFQTVVFDNMEEIVGPTRVRMAENAIESLIKVYKSRQEAKKDQSQGLKSTETDLKNAAEAIRFGEINLSDRDGTDPTIVSKNRIVDFYFSVMDKSQLETIFEEAVGELIKAMKDLSQRSEATATESEESEESEHESMDWEPEQRD